ncbi:oxidoreductase NAD-binding domain-containing protein 1-like isoform X3 [Dreissena polymorpha]|uniref:oxidoreductase NAD-binding domain-containing protein 1-like isoform X3 n=1 Tax=Dreissena polymorpha TaxID=45954 RepID=UPI0022655EC2|nr:oxidoreductase NAD-binding domain-containing protein 1-like isoform X3 [Dreissena polymorpha]
MLPVRKSLKDQLHLVRRLMFSNISTTVSMAQDHLERTSKNSRLEVISEATVTAMKDLSLTVKSLTLTVKDRRLQFSAGQWVDMFTPGVETVGGFSMYSSPCRLATSQQLDLAVKFSKHPPAYWCKVGSQVQIRVGGDFFYDPGADNSGHDLLLIAGGVGINPLFSILSHFADICKGGDARFEGIRASRVVLLYSARNAQELIFRNQVEAIANTFDNIQCRFHVTQENNSTSGTLKGHRISTQDVSDCFNWLRKEKTLAYLCGPSKMLSDMAETLQQLGLARSDIHFEKWW